MKRHTPVQATANPCFGVKNTKWTAAKKHHQKNPQSPDTPEGRQCFSVWVCFISSRHQKNLGCKDQQVEIQLPNHNQSFHWDLCRESGFVLHQQQVKESRMVCLSISREQAKEPNKHISRAAYRKQLTRPPCTLSLPEKTTAITFFHSIQHQNLGNQLNTNAHYSQNMDFASKGRVQNMLLQLFLTVSHQPSAQF